MPKGNEFQSLGAILEKVLLLMQNENEKHVDERRRKNEGVIAFTA